jgi:hypothetical protein
VGPSTLVWLSTSRKSMRKSGTKERVFRCHTRTDSPSQGAGSTKAEPLHFPKCGGFRCPRSACGGAVDSVICVSPRVSKHNPGQSGLAQSQFVRLWQFRSNRTIWLECARRAKLTLTRKDSSRERSSSWGSLVEVVTWQRMILNAIEQLQLRRRRGFGFGLPLACQPPRTSTE